MMYSGCSSDFLLRPWRETDGAGLARAADDPQIARWLRDTFPSPYTLADAEDYLALCRGAGEGALYLALETGGQVVGSISLERGSDVCRKSAELGYWLAWPWWGRGWMTEAVGLICREGFARWDIRRIYAQPFAENTGSRRVLEKAGFTLEGVLRQSVEKYGKLQDSCVYSLLREELR